MICSPLSQGAVSPTVDSVSSAVAGVPKWLIPIEGVAQGLGSELYRLDGTVNK